MATKFTKKVVKKVNKARQIEKIFKIDCGLAALQTQLADQMSELQEWTVELLKTPEYAIRQDSTFKLIAKIKRTKAMMAYLELRREKGDVELDTDWPTKVTEELFRRERSSVFYNQRVDAACVLTNAYMDVLNDSWDSLNWVWKAQRLDSEYKTWADAEAAKHRAEREAKEAAEKAAKLEAKREAARKAGKAYRERKAATGL